MDSRDEEPTRTWPEGTAEGHDESLRHRAARAWRDVDKGPKRAILLGFILSWVLWVLLAGEIWSSYHDNDSRSYAIILFPLFYWVLVFAGLWVYRGFKK